MEYDKVIILSPVEKKGRRMGCFQREGHFLCWEGWTRIRWGGYELIVGDSKEDNWHNSSHMAWKIFMNQRPVYPPKMKTFIMGETDQKKSGSCFNSHCNRHCDVNRIWKEDDSSYNHVVTQ